jgi:hypothetical protein
MSEPFTETFAQHCFGNLWILNMMAVELLEIAAQKDLTRLDEKLFLEISSRQPPTIKKRSYWRQKMHPYSSGFPKAFLSIGQVLAHCGLDSRLRVRGRQFTGPCYLHGGDNPTAFRAHLARNLWRCFK